MAEKFSVIIIVIRKGIMIRKDIMIRPRIMFRKGKGVCSRGTTIRDGEKLEVLAPLSLSL